MGTRRLLLVMLTALSFSSLSYLAQAADIVCSCTQAEKCSDIKISFVPSTPGVYMNIEYAYGQRNLEGFASVVRDEKTRQVIYKLANFSLVEQNGKYSLPNRAAKCD